MIDRILQTRDDWSLVLIRLSVGLMVFFPEGLQKLLFPGILGAGRFAAIGIPWPDVLGPFVGVVEIVCGAAIIVGLLTRLVVMPLLVVLFVALLSTKVPILLGHDFLIFHLPRLNRYGFWSMQHEARVDLCMLLACLYLLVAGSGACSIDARLQRRRRAGRGTVGILE
ncbi:MAG TPA: DoxX family protein [Steroidobacteraceae bacterium]|nr:DoxX family protein [Steroidobacteraceae bacterium]